MKTCLIVDDSRVVRKVSNQILTSIGFTCTEAENGQIALDACKTQLPDFILLDWNMPVMDGLQFVQELRKMPDGAKPVVIFCTTENDMKHITEAMSAGANEYIMKPFDADIIRGKIEPFGLLET